MFTFWFIQIFLGKKTNANSTITTTWCVVVPQLHYKLFFLTGFLLIASLRLTNPLNFTNYAHSHLQIIGLFGSIWDGKIILDLNIFLRE